MAALLSFPIVTWGLTARLGLPLADAAFLSGLLTALPLLAVAQITLTLEARVERIPAYVASAGTILFLGFVAAVLGLRAGGWSALGLGPASLGAVLGRSVVVTAAGVALVLSMHGLRRRIGVAETSLVRQLLPVTAREKRYFVGLSLLAGVGEEVAFRGYALGALAPHVGGEWPAALLTSAVFGVMHAYQGAFGMARAAALGFLLAASLIATGTLWPAIACHVALDLLGGLVWGERLTR